MEEEYDIQVDGMRYVPLVRHYDLFSLPRNGNGYLAGSFPDGTTTIEGVPTSAEVRVLLRRPSGEPGDGAVVAVTESAPDGTWLVEGLNPDLRYDVVGRKDGFNDVIMANVKPEVAP